MVTTAVSRQSSQRLVGMNRFNGELLWEVPAHYSFRHNTIASGNGKVFAMDRLDDALQQHLRRRGEKQPDQNRIIALDIQTGHEIWSSTRRVFGTFLNYSEERDVVLQAGSAAGDRALYEVGKGMVAFPSVGGSSPDIPVAIKGDHVEYFHHHPSQVSGNDYNWVASSGVSGASAIDISLSRDAAVEGKRYTLRMHFAEMENRTVGERVFDVMVQGQNVLTDFDILEQTGGTKLAVVKEFHGIPAGDSLKVELISRTGTTVVCGVEIVAEE